MPFPRHLTTLADTGNMGCWLVWIDRVKGDEEKALFDIMQSTNNVFS
jgi:hypothetical protein